jgi:DNA-binding NarL/FixJ family response regulator
MPATSKSRITETTPVRVILCRGVDLRCPESELPFQIDHCEDSTHAFDGCEGVRSNVLIVDLSLFRITEPNPLTGLIGQLSNAFVIGLSDEPDNLDSERIIRAGFAGLLRADETPSTITRAIKAVVDGELWFPREIISRMLRTLLVPDGISRLKPRETEIFKLIGSGLNNQQIADALFISRETVRWHVKGLYSKLGIKDRTSARDYCRSIQATEKAKPARPEIGEDFRRSGTAS